MLGDLFWLVALTVNVSSVNCIIIFLNSFSWFKTVNVTAHCSTHKLNVFILHRYQVFVTVRLDKCDFVCFSAVLQPWLFNITATCRHIRVSGFNSTSLCLSARELLFHQTRSEWQPNVVLAHRVVNHPGGCSPLPARIDLQTLGFRVRCSTNWVKPG